MGKTLHILLDANVFVTVRVVVAFLVMFVLPCSALIDFFPRDTQRGLLQP